MINIYWALQSVYLIFPPVLLWYTILVILFGSSVIWKSLINLINQEYREAFIQVYLFYYTVYLDFLIRIRRRELGVDNKYIKRFNSTSFSSFLHCDSWGKSISFCFIVFIRLWLFHVIMEKSKNIKFLSRKKRKGTLKFCLNAKIYVLAGNISKKISIIE